MKNNIEFLNANITDLDNLVDIRIAAMEESLKKIGRFNPETARKRLVDTFNPSKTTLIKANGNIIGFYSIDKEHDKLFIKHLYIIPQYHGQGIGTIVLNKIKNNSNKGIKLLSIKGSKANNFYEKNGFSIIGEEEYDYIFEWKK